MKLLIATPYLRVIGGTEIETLITARELASSGIFSEVLIFSPKPIEHSHLKELVCGRNISFHSYPSFFWNQNVKNINNQLKSRLKLKTSPLEYFYWKFIASKGVNKIIFLSSTGQNFYLPILNFFDLRNCFIKYTVVYDEAMPSWKKKILRKLKWNIVMSKNHQAYLQKELKIKNAVVQDIIIANEEALLNTNSIRKFTFGILSRISREKQIQDAILLVKKLKINGISTSLLIQGEGDQDYFKELLKLVEEANLEEEITLINKSIPPNQSHEFYGKISFFLITSKHETGPMTGLEAIAAGVPVLSYNVGAMKERLSRHSYLVVENFQELIGLATQLITLEEKDYKSLAHSLRQHYKSECSNDLKIKKLEKLILK
ncbi:glycosyltransferase [Salegentibacter sp. LM13S]|uniref:glycosyltransferase n=1 Tax=Salegentibacter lacus TaxID=2873599 RepID=UPI001CCD42B7|nr:glycosyltransferase [Salegentibacter lacus]MBZ9632355.1 glycosyltransferase [Salegentibacter lacus]